MHLSDLFSFAEPLLSAVEVTTNPVEAGGGTFVDDETGGVTTDGLNRLFDGGETILGSLS